MQAHPKINSILIHLLLLTSSFLLFFYSIGFSNDNIAIIADKDTQNLVTLLQELSPSFIFLENEQNNKQTICSYKKLLIIGPEAYLKNKQIKCKKQTVFLAGVLYPKLLGVEENIIIISPLPSYKAIKKIAGKWLIVYSEYLEYYIKYLKQFLEIKDILVHDLYELPLAFKRVKKEIEKDNQFFFLILPDPIFLDPEGEAYLVAFIKKYDIKNIDLLGIEEIKGKKIPFSERSFAKTILKVLSESFSLQKARIIYNEDLSL